MNTNGRVPRAQPRTVLGIQPASALPEGKGFGAEWFFDGKPESSEVHSGADYALAAGTPVTAVADGTVALAEDLFFTGNAVFVDHGDGLVSMYFHLSELKVQAGQDVKRGEVLGSVGANRARHGTALPHGSALARRPDRAPTVFEDPARIPAIGQ